MKGYTEGYRKTQHRQKKGKKPEKNKRWFGRTRRGQMDPDESEKPRASVNRLRIHKRGRGSTKRGKRGNSYGQRNQSNWESGSVSSHPEWGEHGKK